jgi:RNA polymerase sigma-70 factor (ECF subfamily)
MACAAEGEREAYEALVRRHQRRLRAYCARQCGSAALGDDVAQECFVELWQQRRAYRAQGKLKSYLFHIAANRCKNQRRKQQRDAVLAGEANLEPSADAPQADALARQRRRRCVERGLEQLPEAQRDAILLRYTAELEYREIASLLGAPEPTVRTRVFLGLIKLRRFLRPERMR